MPRAMREHAEWRCERKRPGRAPSLALPGHTPRGLRAGQELRGRRGLENATRTRSRAVFLVLRGALGLVLSDRRLSGKVASRAVVLDAQQILHVAHARD